MEALSKLKFWKSTTTKLAVDGEIDDRETVADSTVSDPLTDYTDDDDESFFELELTLPKFNPDSPNQTTKPDLISEPKFTSSKPQSPISILRSASPKLSIFMFGKLKKKSKRVSDGNDDDLLDTESNSSSFSPKSNDSSLFTVKFKIEDGSIVPKLTRTNSSNTTSCLSRRSSDEPSKRFSKDGVQKYLSFVKPLYSKRSSDGGERIATAVLSSPTRSSSFPSPRREEKSQLSSRFNLKQLRKSKSATAMVVSPSQVNFPARNDHPCENIEAAILHCKRSFTSKTIGHSSLSRCSSDPSHDKSIQVSEDLSQEILQ